MEKIGKIFNLDNVKLWFTANDNNFPWSLSNRSGTVRMNERISKELNDDVILETKVEKKRRKSLDDNVFNDDRGYTKLIANYVASAEEIFSEESDETQLDIILELLDRHKPYASLQLKLIDLQAEFVHKINNPRNTTELKHNGKEGVNIKRAIFGASIGPDISRCDLQNALGTSVNFNLFDELKSCRENLMKGLESSFMPNWSSHPTLFDAPEVLELIHGWYLREEVSTLHHGGTKTTVRDPATGKIEKPIIRAMLVSAEKNHENFCADEEIASKMIEFCGCLPSVEALKSKRPPHVKWVKDPSRAIDKLGYLVRQNWKECYKFIKTSHGEETAKKLLGDDPIAFVRNHVCSIPDGNSENPAEECDRFFSCLDNECPTCSFFKLFTTGCVPCDDEDLDVEAFDEEETPAHLVNVSSVKKKNSTWSGAQQFPATKSIFADDQIEICEDEIMQFWDYEQKIKFNKKKKCEYKIEVCTHRDLKAIEFFTKFERLLVISRPHFWALEMQNKCMTAERKNLMSSRGTAVHTYDYIMKMNMFDGMVQSQEQYRAGENLAGETYYSVFQTRDMKMKLRKRPDGPNPTTKIAGCVLSDDAGSNLYSHAVNLDKWLNDPKRGILNLVRVKHEIFHSDGPGNCYKNVQAMKVVKDHAVKRGYKYGCAMNISATGGGKGPWDGLGGVVKRAYKGPCATQLQTDARNGPKITKWMNENMSVATKFRQNSYEKMHFHWTPKAEVQKFRDEFPKLKTLRAKGAKTSSMTRKFHNFILPSTDDNKLYGRRFGCGTCLFCRSNDWLNCSRKFICGRFYEGEIQKVGEKRKRQIKSPSTSTKKKKKTKKNN